MSARSQKRSQPGWPRSYEEVLRWILATKKTSCNRHLLPGRQGITSVDRQDAFAVGLHCHEIKNKFKKDLVDKVKKFWCYRRLKTEDSSLSFKSVPFPKLQNFDQVFCTNLQSQVWSRHNDVPRSVRHQQGGRKMVQTSATFFGYLDDWFSLLNKKR